jgi:hypothetical protein
MPVRHAGDQRAELDALGGCGEIRQHHPAFEQRIFPPAELDEVVPDPDGVKASRFGAATDIGEVAAHLLVAPRPIEIVDFEPELHRRLYSGLQARGDGSPARSVPQAVSESRVLALPSSVPSGGTT